MNKQLVFSALLLSVATHSFAQGAEEAQQPWTFSGYAEAYYLHDFNDPEAGKLPGFVYSFNKSGEANINLALVKASYAKGNLRGNLGIADGTYMKANYTAEPGVLNNIYEANVGFKLSQRHDLWLDVGVLPSHIGFESTIGKDNWTLTRSLSADNSPFFETGAKVTYVTPDGKWLVSGLILNGWQRIQRPDGNSTPAIGHQIVYKPNDRVTLNSSSFIGNDKSDDQRQMRYFHNFYAQFQLNDQWSLTTGFDIGAEEKPNDASGYNVWYTPTVIARYAATDKLGFGARVEYYRDKHGVMIGSDDPDGFKITGYSLNADYMLLPNLVWRGEIKSLNGSDGTFAKDENETAAESVMAVTSLALSF
ncbi:MAG: porin [Nevskiaceae bacterium]|jgi:hypothetical protein|nr:porin [Nevskiaceae bacterium]